MARSTALAAKVAPARNNVTVADAGFDYKAEAELFPTRNRNSRLKPLKYMRFPQAAKAIQFAVEELSPERLRGAYLEVNEERYNSDGIRRLYDNTAYPLLRRTAS
ncbi:MAG TPA: hypothetical protein VM867_02855 [Xanthobacteraceae bacterium]|nr:hypothetical protein [Xanthobacteraceae bacterium]